MLLVMKKLILTDLHQSIINIRANEDGLNRLNEFLNQKNVWNCLNNDKSLFGIYDIILNLQKKYRRNNFS